MKQPCAEAMFAAFEAQLGINPQPEMDVKQRGGEIPKEPLWWRNKGNPVVTCQDLGGKQKEPD